jgi:hypothetical protein
MRKCPAILILLIAAAFSLGCGSGGTGNANNINLKSTPDKAEQIIQNQNAQRK